MAYRSPNADTTITSTTGWDTVTNTPTMHASTNVNVNATARFTATFTAPNTTNACTGVWFYLTSVGSATSWDVTLQESTVDTVAVVSLDPANLASATWVYVRFAVPYVFTTTSAGAYRFKIQAVSASSSGTMAADSGGSLYAFLATDNRLGALGSTDRLLVGQENGSGTRTVTVDGTAGTVGNGGDESIAATQRSINNAVVISKGGLFVWDTAASATLVSTGNIVCCSGGELRIGTVATPYPSDKVAHLQFNPSSSGDYGFRNFDGGKVTLQGTPKTSTSLWKTKYSSGVGTAADPLIVTTSVDWSVGDEIMITATGNNAANYNESENKFIITKNSATSYVLSDTAGGVESALTYTHTTNAHVLNLQRNIIIDTDSTTLVMYFTNNSSTSGDFDVDWVRFETMGIAGTTQKEGIVVTRSAGQYGNIDYSVAYRVRYAGFYWATSKNAQTYNGLIACNSTQTTSGIATIHVATNGNKTFNDCFAVKNNRDGVATNGSNGCTFNRLIMVSNNLVESGATVAQAALSLTTGVNTYNDCEITATAVKGLYVASNIGSVFNNLHCGDYGTNAIDIYVTTDSLNQITFLDSTFSSATRVENYLSQLTGSEIKFQNEGATNNNFWYTNMGIARSTGAGLADTTVRTPGSLGIRLASEDATDGFVWEFNIPAKASSIVNFFGWFQKNVAFGTDVCRIELWLPGSATADDSVTLSNTTGSWQAAVLSASNSNTTDSLATIKVIALTTTSAAYIYADDFYNAGDTVTSTDKVTGLDTWYNGKPVVIISPQATSAADIWTFPTTNLTTANTTGKRLLDGLLVGQFIALK